MNLKAILSGVFCALSVSPAIADCTAVITPSGPLQICPGDSVVLRAPQGAGLSYQWRLGSTNVGTNADSFVVKQDGNYTVTVNDGTCSNTSAVVSVTSFLPHLADISPAAPMTLCPGDSKLAFVFLTFGGGPASDYIYKWEKDGNHFVTNNGVNEIFLNAAGIYTVLVTDKTTGCSKLSLPYEVRISTPPAAVITPSGATEICEGATVVLDAGIGAGYDYQWRRDGTVEGVQSAFTATESGEYKVIITDPQGCKDTSEAAVVTLYPRPEVTLGQADTAICAGELVRLDAQTPDTGLLFMWYASDALIAGADEAEYEVTETDEYYVVVSRRGVQECADTSEAVTVTVNELPQPLIVEEEGTLRTEDGFASYQWYLGEDPVAGAEDSVWVTEEPGLYKVRVTDTNGCAGFSDTLRVEEQPSLVEGLADDVAVRIYPNPVHDILNVEARMPVDVRVTDMQGRLILLHQGSREISMQNLRPGMYLLQVSDRDGRLLRSMRMVKK